MGAAGGSSPFPQLPSGSRNPWLGRGMQGQGLGIPAVQAGAAPSARHLLLGEGHFWEELLP